MSFPGPCQTVCAHSWFSLEVNPNVVLCSKCGAASSVGAPAACNGSGGFSPADRPGAECLSQLETEIRGILSKYFMEAQLGEWRPRFTPAAKEIAQLLALATAARQGGDVQQAPAESLQSGPNESEGNAHA